MKAIKLADGGINPATVLQWFDYQNGDERGVRVRFVDGLETHIVETSAAEFTTLWETAMREPRRVTQSCAGRRRHK